MKNFDKKKLELAYTHAPYETVDCIIMIMRKSDE